MNELFKLLYMARKFSVKILEDKKNRGLKLFGETKKDLSM